MNVLRGREGGSSSPIISRAKKEEKRISTGNVGSRLFRFPTRNKPEVFQNDATGINELSVENHTVQRGLIPPF